ncbi:MAG: hypothetical protein KW804_00590 [Candidatus Doudnabacteria bacterium]|nr:hypothetical protein [Candidatus Doudnabacteria bacterium]
MTTTVFGEPTIPTAPATDAEATLRQEHPEVPDSNPDGLTTPVPARERLRDRMGRQRIAEDEADLRKEQKRDPQWTATSELSPADGRHYLIPS